MIMKSNLELSGNALKVIGVVLMVFDHIHQMFISVAPAWFPMLGRLVLPIFIFMCAEGFYHTSNRKRYMLRLLVAAVVMNIGNRILANAMRIVPDIPEHGVELINSVFTTMLMTTFYLFFIERLREGLRENKVAKIAGSIALMAFPVALTAALVFLVYASDNSQTRVFVNAFFLIPNLLAMDGGVPFMLLGISFYYLRQWRLAQMTVLVLFSALNFFAGVGGGIQWLMVFAVIPLFLYNGRRGGGNKYFFYIFYPAHIWGLYTLAWLLQR
ncbi:membrane protein [Clostridia bacterium]|nr:membrane protein [Clostridia bacterium]